MEAIYQKYGYDFRNYACPSFIRRVNNFLANTKYTCISEMIPDLLRDAALCETLLNSISVTVTEMFRDPEVYKEIREKVAPLLNSFPRINVWHAGCATGEEVYSFAILLKEEGLYDRTNIYGTDMNSSSLTKAREAIFPMEGIQQGTDNYKKSGGSHSFTEYYHAGYGNVILNSSLKENITFLSHNLAVDQVFNQMHLIVCRNVLIYFNRKLQNQVLKLLSDSLIYNGILCLGTKEDIAFSDVKKDFETISKSSKLFKKKAW